MEWHDAIVKISPYIVRVSTPDGSGTGFLVSRSSESPLVAIATAVHVVEDADTWRQPIRIDHYASGEALLLDFNDREVIFEDSDDDTAAIMMDGSKLPLPQDVLPLIGEGKTKKVGVELGWVGFPAVSPGSLCFFSGRVSARLRANKTYLVDGVAINGVSGGPAFSCAGDSVDVVGVVSAYIPNRATGETLPGLAVVQHVQQFQWLAKELKNLDEAAKKSDALKRKRGTSPRKKRAKSVEARAGKTD